MEDHLKFTFGFIISFFSLVLSFDPLCEQVLTGDQGWVVSPQYPDRYPNGVDCRWNIQVQPHQIIELHIEKFVLDGRRGDNKCFDYLGITDSSSAPLDPTLFEGCSDELEELSTLLSKTNEVFVTFHSDERSAAPVNARFAFHFTALGCPLFNELTGPAELDYLEIDNTTRLATTAFIRCRKGYAFNNTELRKQGFQKLTCRKTVWNTDVGHCIDMSTPVVSFEVTEQTKVMAEPTSEPTVPPKEDGTNGGVIAGIILGLIAVVVLVLLVIFLWRKHKRGKGTPRRPPTVHNDQMYGPTTQPIETVSGKNRFGLFQKSKDKYNKDDHQDVGKNLLTNGKPSKNAEIAALYEEVDDNSRTQLTGDHSDVEFPDHHDPSPVVYYEPDHPDVVHIENGGGDPGKLDNITTVENKHYNGP